MPYAPPLPKQRTILHGLFKEPSPQYELSTSELLQTKSPRINSFTMRENDELRQKYIMKLAILYTIMFFIAFGCWFILEWFDKI